MNRASPTGHVVIHVPHSSASVPDPFRDQFTLTDRELAAVHEAMVDHDTDLMAAGLADVVRFPFSRLLVDVERFWDDESETMARIGMGAVYRVDHDLRPIRRDLDQHEEGLLRQIYDDHHRSLERAVDRALDAFDRCLIVDLHSYPADRQTYEQSVGARPHLCLGTDDFHTPEAVASRVETIGADHGLDVRRDTPFAGTLVPAKHHRSDARVMSLMLEWRRDLYRSRGVSDPAALNRLRAVVEDVTTMAIG